MIEIINSEKALYDHIDQLRAKYKKHKFLRVDVKTGKQRSDPQRKSLELYCKFIAEALKDKGINFTMFFKPGFEVPWTQEIVKDNVWRTVQIAMFNKISTTKPTRKEYLEIFEVVNLKISEFGIHIPWPCKEEKSNARQP